MQGRAKKIASDEAVAIVENHELAKLDDIEQSLLNEAEDKVTLKKEIVNSKVKRATKVVDILN